MFHSPLGLGRHHHVSAAVLIVLLCASMSNCGKIDRVARLLDRRTARERYETSLERAGLANTALARDWTSVAHRALRDAPLVVSPYTEEGFFPPAEPTALAYRIAVHRGQEVTFDVDLLGDTTALLFVDAWQIETEGEQSFRRIAEADSGKRRLTIEPRQDGELIVRVQPELLRGGRFRTVLRLGPTLAFPLGNGRESNIGSRYGAPRDGGAREHKGIDIFAPRGTPAVAATEATVTRVETTAIGGNVVWLRDARGNSIYYAHLDRQNVSAGDRVRPGDIVGFVGNTGNAISTPPHLHFGVYRRGEGAMNPYWFVHRPGGEVPRLTADTTTLGRWARTLREGAIVRRSPDARGDTVATLPRFTAVRVLAGAGGWHRVRLPDGNTGFLSARLTEPATRALRSAELRRSVPFLARPVTAATTDEVMGEMRSGQSVAVLGRFGDYLLVRRLDGTAGWVSQ